MRIGIDATWLFEGPVSGKSFIRNILPELFGAYPEIEWHIFLNKKNRSSELPFEKKEIRIHYVWARIKMFSHLLVLPKCIKTLKLDAVFFQTFCPRSKSFTSIVFIHDVLFRSHPTYYTWKEKLYFFPLRWTTGFAERIVTTTEFVKQEMLIYHFVKDSQKIDIVPLGLSGIFKPLDEQDELLLKKIKEKYKLPDEYLLFVGRLNARKNVETLLKVLTLLKENISLVIVGEKDWKRPRLHQLLKDKNIRTRTQFIGSVSDLDLSAIYAMAKIFCFPSFAEGFGLPPLEAMASGIPVLVSNTTALPEVCGNAAVYVDAKNEKDIAEKINKLLADKSFYEQKIKEGLEWSKQYTWKRTAEGIMRSILRQSTTKGESI